MVEYAILLRWWEKEHNKSVKIKLRLKMDSDQQNIIALREITWMEKGRGRGVILSNPTVTKQIVELPLNYI